MHFGNAQYKQKGFAGVYILIGLLVLVTVIGGAYYFGKTQAPQSQDSTFSQSSPTPLPSVTSVKEGDETANWKTYTNS